MPGKFRETLRDLKRTKSASKTIRICPVCNRPTLRMADSISGWMTAETYKCDDCGYRGQVYLEVDADEYEKWILKERRDSKRDKDDNA